MSRIRPATIAVVSPFTVGFVGIVLVGILVPAHGATAGATIMAVTGIGALCAVIGAAARWLAEALVAGSAGFVLAIVFLQGGDSTALGMAWALVNLGIPYLAGFGVVALVAVLAEPQRTS